MSSIIYVAGGWALLDVFVVLLFLRFGSRRRLRRARGRNNGLARVVQLNSGPAARPGSRPSLPRGPGSRK